MHATVNPFTRIITLKDDDFCQTLSFDHNKLNEIDTWWELTINDKNFTVHVEYCDGFELSMFAYIENSSTSFNNYGTLDSSVNYITNYTIEYKIWNENEQIEISKTKTELLS
jgi:hypothetical protein